MARGNSLGRLWEILILDEGAFAFVHFSFWLAVVIQADMRRFFFFFNFFFRGRDNDVVSRTAVQRAVGRSFELSVPYTHGCRVGG